MAIKTLKSLSIPKEAGCIFTLPKIERWALLLDENKRSLFGVDGRSGSRSELVNIAAEYTRRMGFSVSHLNGEADIIATGHQPNWHHCGIFAKNIVTDKLAKQTNGLAIQLVLDHDICETSMSVPVSNNNVALRFETIPLEKMHSDLPLEFRLIPSREQLKEFMDSVFEISKNSFCYEIWRRDAQQIINSITACRSVADIVTQQQARLNQALGLEIMYLPVSLMSQTNCFVDFLYSIICDAVNFAGFYNQTINNKREADDLKSNQTIRLLKIDSLNKIVELPFWLSFHNGQRTSLYVSFDDKSLRIGTSGKIVGTINTSAHRKQQFLEMLREKKCVIRPKAVMLTLFARMHLADLFVHGTGAGNYEYITDYLIKTYYEIAKLDFGVATASMTLPADGNNWDSKLSKRVLNYREFFFGLFPKDRLEKLADFNEVENANCFSYCSTSG